MVSYLNIQNFVTDREKQGPCKQCGQNASSNFFALNWFYVRDRAKKAKKYLNGTKNVQPSYVLATSDPSTHHINEIFYIQYPLHPYPNR